MGAGSPGAASGHDQTWDHLRDRGDFDIALLQETREPPSWVKQEGGSYVWRPKYEGHRVGRSLWGSAVVARGFELKAYEPAEDYPWLRALPGSTAIGRMSSDPVWLVSVHLHSRRIPDAVVTQSSLDGVELTTPDGSVWETNVVPHELHRLFAGETYIWGGDFNSDPRMDGVAGFSGGNRRAFDLYREAGSLDARARFHPDYQRTYFNPRRRAYQLDHVFTDANTERRIKSWAVDSAPATGPSPLSDHAPILVTLDGPPR